MIISNDKVTHRNDMTKNLNIRLEDKTFEAFTEYCKATRSSKTDILKDYIERLISGELKPFYNDSNDGNAFTNVITSNASNDIEEAIANHPKLKALEDKLKGLIELVESKLCNDAVMIDNDDGMTDNSVMISNDISLQNESSEDSLQGGVKEIQALEAIEEPTPLETAKTEEKSESEPSEVPEKPPTTEIQDNGGEDRIETAIAKLEKLSFRELKSLVSVVNSKKPKTISNYRGNKEAHLGAIREGLKGEGKDLILEALK